ncbi:MAG: hypothetical protein JW828_08505, partial [Sedimentisphaerales bacterium]|nr:hypothetical protein [Sedimentisphaerales bacterium]
TREIIMNHRLSRKYSRNTVLFLVTLLGFWGCQNDRLTTKNLSMNDMDYSRRTMVTTEKVPATISNIYPALPSPDINKYISIYPSSDEQKIFSMPLPREEQKLFSALSSHDEHKIISVHPPLDGYKIVSFCPPLDGHKIIIKGMIPGHSYIPGEPLPPSLQQYLPNLQP